MTGCFLKEHCRKYSLMSSAMESISKRHGGKSGPIFFILGGHGGKGLFQSIPCPEMMGAQFGSGTGGDKIADFIDDTKD